MVDRKGIGDSKPKQGKGIDDHKAIEGRIIGVESTFAYQDERLRKLEEVVSQQQLELHELRTALDLLAKAVRPPNADAANEKPPHY